MRKVIFLCLVALLMQDQLSAQTSIGFSDNNPKAIKDYRLPDWGYKRGWIDAYWKREHSSTNQSYSDQDDINNKRDFNLNSDYIIMRESESQNHTISASGSYFNRKTDSKYPNSHNDNTYKIRSNQKDLFAQINGRSAYYSNGYHAMIQPRFIYRHHKNNQTIEANVYKSKSNSYDLSLATLFGIGRIRNVAPIIRAMRVRERLNAIGKGESWGDETTQRVADEFSRLYGYQNVYDRHQKEFWKSLDEYLPELTPFEAHYMNDVFREAIGNRLEGYMINFGPRIIRYQDREKFYTKDFFGVDEGVEKFRATYLGLILNGEMYHNYSMKGQIGVSATGSFDFRSGSKKYNPISDIKQMRLAVDHLYSIADRLLWTANASYSNAHVKLGDKDAHETFKSKVYELNTGLSYYIEHRVSISGNASWSKRKNSPASELYGYLNMDMPGSIKFYNNAYLYNPDYNPTSSKYWTYSISLTYYFNRALL